MKRNIGLFASAVVASFVLSACGSNDKPDGNIVTDGNAAMSILQEGEVKFDIERGCMKLFVVHAVDGNGNPIPGLTVDANVIINVKARGALGTIQTTAPLTLTDGSKNFESAHVNAGDKLIILPTSQRHDISYLGDWKIHAVEGNTLKLNGVAYNLETTDQINYVVGNEATYVPGYGSAVAHVEQRDENGTTARVTNDDGYAYFDVVYDLSLVGHIAIVGAHNGDGYRMGAAVSGVLPDCRTPVDTNDSTSNSSTSTCSGSTSGTCPAP